MQIRVADSQSRTPGWVSVNAFAHLQLWEGASARAPVVFSFKAPAPEQILTTEELMRVVTSSDFDARWA